MIMKFVMKNIVFTVIALAFLLISLEPHHAIIAIRVVDEGAKHTQEMGPVPSSAPNSCEKIPINGPPCSKKPPPSPPRSHATMN